MGVAITRIAQQLPGGLTKAPGSLSMQPLVEATYGEVVSRRLASVPLHEAGVFLGRVVWEITHLSMASTEEPHILSKSPKYLVKAGQITASSNSNGSS